MQIFPQTNELIWTIINFAVLLWGMHRFLYKPLLGAIQAREDEINANLKKAAEDRAEAERLRREFEAQIANAQREAQEIINKAVKNATAVKEQIEAEARARAAEILEQATQTIEREKAKAVAELRREVADLAVAVAGKVIEKSLDDAEHRRLADSFVTEVTKH
ncbi:ATP synthase B subunit [Symbiobacterium thermophilum IAM 14863]|uniref:ATP synthase subunit b n=1 Tax=Symbiobacterium thermophilum (strain DSM 24528 / JCM 14929 / IAM 14863 / T) TaxID=292459 RepID=ATPF_SYMTH|nr:RecName: Full=ATP synthase subunit b; AltName: Full=ATP synthase F(0) sector subunit b; AltName: Full=ATPase subunit I; AltName: Full=F-type ATPase subunit b; Short=F-ATPase subunit b [Symbiobacterium thermophilum IAM 14863]BAD39072.1 ATP synthase B subunit [Symbiobacterium thermophilum IAM 14863]